MKDQLSGRVRHVGHFGQPRHYEAPDRAGAHQQRFLRAQVLGDVDEVKQVASRLDAVAHDSLEQGMDAAHQRVGEIRIGHNILERTLHAAQAAIEIEGFVGHAQHGILGMILGALDAQARIVEIARIRPGAGIDIGDGFGVGERRFGDLLIDAQALAIFDRAGFDTEQAE